MQTFPLSMHIGLGAGVVYDMHVGSVKHGRWEYFVDGEAIQEALKLVNIARQKELAVSDTVAYMLQNEVRSVLYVHYAGGRSKEGQGTPCP
jgi:class 3 adenylate cyclase